MTQVIDDDDVFSDEEEEEPELEKALGAEQMIFLHENEQRSPDLSKNDHSPDPSTNL